MSLFVKQRLFILKVQLWLKLQTALSDVALRTPVREERRDVRGKMRISEKTSEKAIRSSAADEVPMQR